jgi:hypothetical protein
VPITTGDLFAALAVAEPLVAELLVADPLVAEPELALEELLLEPPHPARNAAIAATAATDSTQPLRLDLVILTSPPSAHYVDLRNTERVRRPGRSQLLARQLSRTADCKRLLQSCATLAL